MPEAFAPILAVGGKSNSLGRAEEVVQKVLQDKTRLDELYDCLFEEDAWLRMRAADSLEKVCRVHPEWFEPYTERLLHEIAKRDQPSLQWHLAQMLGEINLTPAQRQAAIHWLETKLNNTTVDWIVAANAMATLVQFAHEGSVPKAQIIPLLKNQQEHHSKAVVKRAAKLLNQLGADNK